MQNLLLQALRLHCIMFAGAHMYTFVIVALVAILVAILADIYQKMQK